ncbi:hypothetical protein SUGI_0998380 [Cryptomeria japonica]|nr:hypothetical protein SUGI_0998380 [Cryptomeria japonica]
MHKGFRKQPIFDICGDDSPVKGPPTYPNNIQVRRVSFNSKQVSGSQIGPSEKQDHFNAWEGRKSQQNNKSVRAQHGDQCRSAGWADNMVTLAEDMLKTSIEDL